ncbi:MAG: sulfite exporter TauE/SafE family protein [Gammaproteobacteria bacterium]
MDFLHISAGAIVGLIIGLTGVGGGSLMTPILVLGFGFAPTVAVGTDLLYAALTKSSGVFFHHKNRTIDWKIVFLLGLGSIPSSIVTIQCLDKIRSLGFDYNHVVMSTLSIMLILTSFIVILKNRLLLYAHSRHPDNLILSLVRQFRSQITWLCGIVLGVVVTISSVGAGAIGAAILFLMYPKKKSVEIVGTDLAHAVPLTAVAGVGHFHFGTVDMGLLGGLLLGGIPCIYLGSLIGKKLPDSVLRPLIAMILFILGIKILI